MKKAGEQSIPFDRTDVSNIAKFQRPNTKIPKFTKEKVDNTSKNTAETTFWPSERLNTIQNTPFGAKTTKFCDFWNVCDRNPKNYNLLMDSLSQKIGHRKLSRSQRGSIDGKLQKLNVLAMYSVMISIRLVTSRTRGTLSTISSDWSVQKIWENIAQSDHRVLARIRFSFR